MKKLLKGFIIAIFYIIVLPAGLLSRLIYNLFHSAKFYDLFTEVMAVTPGFIGTYCRACFYKQTLDKSSLDLDIGFGSIFSKIETRVGRGVLITGHTTIGLADIGDYAVIANYVSILSGRYHHNFQDVGKKILNGQDTFLRISIGANSFVGDNSTVMADIGKNSIVGAGSVVVKPVPDNVVVVGNPARVVKERSPEK